MVNESFYTLQNIQQATPMRSLCTITFNPAHEIFKAHFPGNPIIPGVCCVEIVRQAVGNMLDTDLRISVVKNLKFISLMTPAVNKSFVFDMVVAETAENQYSVKVTVTQATAVMTKMSLVCHKS